MTSFRSEIKIPKSVFKIKYTDAIFCIGSCFTEHIHKKFESLFFSSYSNPNGIVYNPVSISRQINHLLSDEEWASLDLYFDGEWYHGLHHHGDFSGRNEQAVLDNMNESGRYAKEHLEKSDVVLVTLGTSIVYVLKEKNILVANCHKIPNYSFERKFLEVDEIVDSTSEWINALTRINPQVNIILTISPVRYLKEGFTDNTLSKARLALAVEKLVKSNNNIHYFPAYEIVLDDLRDYRFYSEDLAHPNRTAIDYVWSKFKEIYFNQDSIHLLDKLDQIRKAKNHRPIHADSMEHRKFLAKLEMDIIELKMKYPDLNL